MATPSLRTESGARSLEGGAAAGVVAGIALALFNLAVNLLRGGDGWVALKGAAAPFIHQRAMQPGFDSYAVLLGLACHLAVSLVWGVAFAAVAYGLNRASTVIAGFIWGFVVWFGMFYVVMPLLGMGPSVRHFPASQALPGHILFGLILGLAFLPFQVPHQHDNPDMDTREPIKNS
jgi:hypothetical protein